MAKKSWMVKQQRKPKFSTRKYNRCHRCCRSRWFIGDFGLFRICFRDLALKRQIPGVVKASW